MFTNTIVKKILVIFTLFLPYFVLADDLPEGPYTLGDGDFIFLGVEWDAESIEDFLPNGIEPVSALTGGINIYFTNEGPWTWDGAYYWIDVEGFDSPDGTKGRFVMAGQYGPTSVMPTIVSQKYAFPNIRRGSTRHEVSGDEIRSFMTLAGKDLVETRIKMTGDCYSKKYSNTLYYLGENSEVGIMVLEIPYDMHLMCPAKPEAVIVKAAGMDPYSKMKISKMTWAARVLGSSTWLPPQLVGQK